MPSQTKQTLIFSCSVGVFESRWTCMWYCTTLLSRVVWKHHNRVIGFLLKAVFRVKFKRICVLQSWEREMIMSFFPVYLCNVLIFILAVNFTHFFLHNNFRKTNSFSFQKEEKTLPHIGPLKKNLHYFSPLSLYHRKLLP